MALADFMASPRMVWMSLDIERMVDSTFWDFEGGSPRPWLSQDKQSINDRAMAHETVIAVDESTVTLERHVSMECSGTGNRSVGTRGVLGGGGGVASSVRTGKRMVPRTPVWSKKEVERVGVSPICVESYRGSHIVR
jgi:hypothetical protein